MLRRGILLLARVVAGVLTGNLARGTGVEFIKSTLGDTVEELLGVNAEQVPGDVQRLENGAGLVGRLTNKAALEFVEELQRKFVFRRKGFFSNDGLHGGYVVNPVRMTNETGLDKQKRLTSITTDSILRVELVGHI